MTRTSEMLPPRWKLRWGTAAHHHATLAVAEKRGELWCYGGSCDSYVPDERDD